MSVQFPQEDMLADATFDELHLRLVTACKSKLDPTLVLPGRVAVVRCMLLVVRCKSKLDPKLIRQQALCRKLADRLVPVLAYFCAYPCSVQVDMLQWRQADSLGASDLQELARAVMSLEASLPPALRQKSMQRSSTAPEKLNSGGAIGDAAVRKLQPEASASAILKLPRSNSGKTNRQSHPRTLQSMAALKMQLGLTGSGSSRSLQNNSFAGLSFSPLPAAVARARLDSNVPADSPSSHTNPTDSGRATTVTGFLSLTDYAPSSPGVPTIHTPPRPVTKNATTPRYTPSRNRTPAAAGTENSSQEGGLAQSILSGGGSSMLWYSENMSPRLVAVDDTANFVRESDHLTPLDTHELQHAGRSRFRDWV